MCAEIRYVAMQTLDSKFDNPYSLIYISLLIHFSCTSISLSATLSFPLHLYHPSSAPTGTLNLIHLAERASYRLLDLYRDAGKIEKMAAEYKRAASAFREISDLASTQFALGTFYSVLYLGLGERIG